MNDTAIVVVVVVLFVVNLYYLFRMIFNLKEFKTSDFANINKNNYLLKLLLSFFILFAFIMYIAFVKNQVQ